MESMIETTKYYANNLFVFEPSQPLFYSYEEFLFQFTNSSNPITINLNPKFLDTLQNTKQEAPSQTNDNPIQNTLPSANLISSLGEQQDTEKGIEDNTDEAKNENPDLQKHNFDLFLEIVDIKEYTVTMNVQDFFNLYVKYLGEECYKLAAYFYFRRKNYEIESGCIFSFDFLLYKNSGGKEIGLMNKKDRIHSEYGVFLVNEDSKINITFKDVHRKCRIAHNYNKVFFLFGKIVKFILNRN